MDESTYFNEGFKIGVTMQRCENPYGNTSYKALEWSRGYLEGYYDSENYPPED